MATINPVGQDKISAQLLKEILALEWMFEIA